jgi:hypothetical protein
VTFPNLARRKQDGGSFDLVDVAAVTAVCEQELLAAGANVTIFPSINEGRTEVPNLAFGTFGMWTFERAWYYWVAKGPGLPVEVAERLHAEHGSVVRVDGHCGCPSPREWFKGFGVPHYHVDTPEGLKALIDALRSVNDPDTDPDAMPRTGKREARVVDYRRKETVATTPVATGGLA